MSITLRAILKSAALTAVVLSAAVYHSHTFAGTKEYTAHIVDVDRENASTMAALETLRKHGSEESSRICLNINSYGGSVSLMYEFLNEIDKAKAEVVTVVNGFAMSAGGVIAMAGDKIKFSKHSLFMIHRARHLDKKGEVVIGNKRSDIIINNLMLSYYGGLLFKKEIKLIVDGGDFDLDGAHLKARLKITSKERLANDNVCTGSK